MDVLSGGFNFCRTPNPNTGCDLHCPAFRFYGYHVLFGIRIFLFEGKDNAAEFGGQSSAVRDQRGFRLSTFGFLWLVYYLRNVGLFEQGEHSELTWGDSACGVSADGSDMGRVEEEDPMVLFDVRFLVALCSLCHRVFQWWN